MALDLGGLDFADRKTQLIAVGGVAAGLVLLTRLHKATPAPAPAPTATLVPPQGTTWADIMGARNQDAGQLAVVGTYPTPGPPGTQGATGAPGPAGPPGPVTTPKPVPTPTPQPTHKLPYYCPSGSVMTKERGNTGNDVCQRPDGTQFQVVYYDPPTARYPTTGGASDWIRVQYQGVTGYAYHSYLAGNKVTGTGTDGLNLRNAPNFSGIVLKVIPEGSTVQLMPAAGEVNPSPGKTVGGFFGQAMPIGGRLLTVQPGETPRTLAGRAYGIPQAWPQIVLRNGGRMQFVVGDQVKT